ncbi:MAG TPA: putative inorganic carbon transporter subunit DabA, partial [Candidatus Acidoferrum sp.]|nr:putative inorganic carbon transporter subunit DabA [Candidatus Acidoferrum sp.]
MAQLGVTAYSEIQRAELRALVRLASEVVAYYWPMRNFVHHNPLHGLEDLPFEKAVRHGQQLLAGKGYLSNETFREYFRSGRILPRNIDAELRGRTQGERIQIGDREVHHLDVLHAHLTHGLFAPSPEVLDVQIEGDADRQAIRALADYLSYILTPENGDDSHDFLDLSRTALLATWCDRLLGTQIADQINLEMIKWCAAFLDEGHATWSMPLREEGFYGAWKLLMQWEWSPDVGNHREKLARLPVEPEDAVMACLAGLGVPPNAWQDYLSRHLTALPGWAGFIKWRADQSEYEWQSAYPIDLVQYAAVRLWYERELVQSACQEMLGIDASFDALSAAA